MIVWAGDFHSIVCVLDLKERKLQNIQKFE